MQSLARHGEQLTAEEMFSALQPVAGGKQWQCGLCEKTCSSKGNARLHVRLVHLEEKKFRCHHCDKQFGMKGNLSAHLRICSKN